MFFRTKTSGPRTYLQVVENRWEGGRSRQRVVATLGRLDQLQEAGQLDAPPPSRARPTRPPPPPRRPPGPVGPADLRARPGPAADHLGPAHRPGPGLPAALG